MWSGSSVQYNNFPEINNYLLYLHCCMLGATRKLVIFVSEGTFLLHYKCFQTVRLQGWGLISKSLTDISLIDELYHSLTSDWLILVLYWSHQLLNVTKLPVVLLTKDFDVFIESKAKLYKEALNIKPWLINIGSIYDFVPNPTYNMLIYILQ